MFNKPINSLNAVVISSGASLLHSNGGRALILCNSDQELAELREELGKEGFPFKLLWEGTGDKGGLVEQFRRD